MSVFIDTEQPEVFHSFKVEVGPHMTSLKTPKNMTASEVRRRVIQAMDAMLGLTAEKDEHHD